MSHNKSRHDFVLSFSSSSLFPSFLFLQASSVSTSYSIDLCDSSLSSSSTASSTANVSDSSSSCIPSMQVVVTLDDTSPPLVGFQLPKNKIITDSQGRQWSVGENVLLEIERSPITVNYDLTFGGFAYNAYEQVYAPSWNCVAMPNQMCCPFTTSAGNNLYFLREMKQNVTRYNYYYASMNSPQYSIQVRAVQSSKTETLTLTNTVKKQTGLGITAWVVADLIDVTRYMFFSNDFVVIPENYATTQEGFLAGRYYFGDAINRIGISQSTYMRNVKCTDKQGLLTSVSGSSLMDQFEKFRKDTISNAVGCTFSPSLTTVSTFKRSYQYICQKIVSTQIVLRIPTDGSGVKIIRLFGNPVITKSGVNVNDDTASMEMFIDVFNNADTSGSFDVIPTSCCVANLPSSNEPFWDCSSVTFSRAVSQTVESYKAHRFIFSMLLDQVVKKYGYCTFSVMQYGKTDVTHSINFTTQSISSNPIYNESPAVQDDCIPPYGKKIFGVGNKVLCITECPSQDLMYDSVKFLCKPVDCKIKYNATRNFFNPETQLCEMVKTCLEWKEDYNAITNTCQVKESFRSNQTQPTGQDLDLMNEVNIVTGLQCGQKGDSSQDKTRCMCKLDSHITAFDYKSWNPMFSNSQSDSQFCMVDTLSLNNPPNSDNVSSSILDMVIMLDVWVQLVIAISSCVFAIILYLITSICCPCCCIQRMNMRMEVQKREYGEYKRKTLCEIISSVLCYGDCSMNSYHLSEERANEIMKEQFELNLWRKKRLKHAQVMMEKGSLVVDSDIAVQIQMDLEMDQLEDLLRDKKQDMRMEEKLNELSEEHDSTKDDDSSCDSQHDQDDETEQDEEYYSE
ncbi:hypothetical protein C9374_003861 [Naegleria lovaniensis]|uniref:Uncharacterized protein n=1 Tax=Naegleria lovaniensis TaxID=51637 RepID=A0AA88H8K6_NAELO|nr:uncharacterized protein C9374_003861 [Naegleria lovaniensis]KAG2394097.1 hypothetical protein C9374_003861 [Naegleria lovaniensis]